MRSYESLSQAVKEEMHLQAIDRSDLIESSGISGHFIDKARGRTNNYCSEIDPILKALGLRLVSERHLNATIHSRAEKVAQKLSELLSGQSGANEVRKSIDMSAFC